ncbi:MAG: hypothetical protein R3D67_09620 [Hyphomicrobiaceae bacterium]
MYLASFDGAGARGAVMIDRAWDVVSRIAGYAVLAGAALLLIAAGIVTAEVLIRKAVPDLVDLIASIGGLVGLDFSVFVGALPFVAAMMALIVMLMVAPDIALWLPNTVMGVSR